MNLNKIFLKFVLLFLMLLLSACNVEKTSLSELKSVSAESAIPKKRSITKPQPPIEMSYKMANKQPLSVGQKLKINVYIAALIDAQELHLSYSSKPNLILQNPETERWFGEQHSPQSNLLELEVLPQQIGLVYVTLSATLLVDAQKLSRSFVIPLQVGNVNAVRLDKTGVLPEQGDSGVVEQEKIIQMPAVETVH